MTPMQVAANPTTWRALWWRYWNARQQVYLTPCMVCGDPMYDYVPSGILPAPPRVKEFYTCGDCRATEWLRLVEGI